MDIHKLKAFIVVAEQLNFRKSAEILCMTAPPLTRLIASLEKHLETQLFERTTRSVTLTGAGVLLLKEARDIAAAMHRIETEIRSVGKMKSGTLRVGFSKTTFLTRFPAMLDEFQSRFPKTKVELVEAANQDVMNLLNDKRIDVAFSESLPKHNAMEYHKVSSESVGVLLPSKHALAKRKEIRFQDLLDERVIVHSRKEAAEFFERTAHLLQGTERKPQIYLKKSHESCPILVATGKGVSLQVNGAWMAVPQHLRLVPVHDMPIDIYMIWRSECRLPHLKPFLSLVMEREAVLPQRAECLVLST